MKSLLCSFFIIALSHTAGAQDKIIRTLQLESGSVSPKVPAPTPDTIKRLWKKGGIYRINLGQGSLSNWAAGGDEFSLTVNSSLNLYATYKKHNFGWDNSLDLVMGFLNTTTLGSRKNDDRIDFVSKQTYTIDKKTSFATLANFRTQFFAGYTYKEKSKTYASNFLSPGYVLTSIGINSKPVKELSFFVSPLTSRWIIVRNDSLASKAAYGVDTGKNIVNQLGSFATINYQKEFFLTGDETTLRPMILKDIAEVTGLDISTVSRVANSKFVQTEFGTYRLKFFFSESLSTDSGEEVSTREVKKILNDLIEAEEKRKPLSDERLTELLQEKGYNIARRTVAKYREQLNIPVARLRKEL